MKKENISSADIIKAANSINSEGLSEKEADAKLREFIGDSMTSEQSAQLDKLLSDRAAVERLLASDEAKNLIKSLGLTETEVGENG